MRIVPPVFPWRGTRTVDSWGAGGFGAPRDQGARQHWGLDFLGQPGDTIVASISGRVHSLGFMYADSTEMRNIHIDGTGEFEHYHALEGYVIAHVKEGDIVHVGDQIGVLQDVAGYWLARRPTHPGTMQNHCHLGLKINGTNVNPSHYLPADLPTC